MRVKFTDRLWMGFGSLFFGSITYLMCVCFYKIVVDMITHFTTSPLFILFLGAGVLIMALFAIPVAFCITLMFGGWTFGKDIFKIEGDKFDQVEFDFKEK